MHTTANAPSATAERIASFCPNRRAAIAWVRAEADALIEQAERIARGYDKGQHRDDCRTCDRTPDARIATANASRAACAFAIARRFAA